MALAAFRLTFVVYLNLCNIVITCVLQEKQHNLMRCEEAVARRYRERERKNEWVRA